MLDLSQFSLHLSEFSPDLIQYNTEFITIMQDVIQFNTLWRDLLLVYCNLRLIYSSYVFMPCLLLINTWLIYLPVHLLRFITLQLLPFIMNHLNGNKIK